MNSKSDVNKGNATEDAIETAGDATIISWSIFASLEELRQASDGPETVQSAAARGDGESDAAVDGNSDNLQAVLDKYTEWLRTFRR